MKYLITGGGTGGHIYPALAIAGEIEKQDREAEILYVGTEKGLESKLVPRAGYKFKTVRVKSLPRKINKDFFISIKELLLGIHDSKKIIKDFDPDIIIGTGGYVCGPVVFLGALKKYRTIIHEQNAYPGITNKILSRFVDKVLITFKEAEKHFPKAKEVVLTGNPVREEILNIDRDRAYEKLAIDENKKLILSFGGSGGQKSLNTSLLEIIPRLSEDIVLMHITGERLYEDFLAELEERGIEAGDNIRILPYLYDMPEALNIADLVITSAGAITLAEISAIGAASILIPKSYTAENHQEYNARSFSDSGAAELIYERDLEADLLLGTIDKLINNDERLEEMRSNSLKIGKKDATSKIFEEISQL